MDTRGWDLAQEGTYPRTDDFPQEPTWMITYRSSRTPEGELKVKSFGGRPIPIAVCLGEFGN